MRAERNRKTLPRLEGRNTAWLFRGESAALADRHLQILEAVREVGSLNAAAKRLHISYRDAWGKVRQAEAVLEVPLIAARVGGAKGGGSRLTPQGEDVVARLRAFRQHHREAVSRAAALYFGGAEPASAAEAGRDHLRLATTTSVVDTGLLAVLLAPFVRRFGVTAEVLPVGSGAALRLAARGRVDAVLTHAPGAESAALQRGDVLNARPIMANRFVLVGPQADPAGARGTAAPEEALRRIAAGGAEFLSRADGSGTHQFEQALLAAAGLRPGRWRRASRGGMAALLRESGRCGAYALTDRGTYAAVADEIDLEVLLEARGIGNAYSVLAANPHRHSGANYLAAMELIAWLTSPPAQELIAAYRIGGRAVARPVARR